jgi:FkbM family methyltransferase
MYQTIYYPENYILSIINKTDQYVDIDVSFLCLDTNLCFFKGWAGIPSHGYINFNLPQDMSLFLNELGIKVVIFDKENGEIIFEESHYTKEGTPGNLIYSDPKDMTYGPWYTMKYKNEYEGLLNVNEDDVVYDLGGNVGVFTKYILNESSVKKVYIFEPTKKLIPYLEKTFSGLENVHIFDKGISGENKECVFYLFNHSVSNTLLDFEGKNETYEGSEIVQCVNLQDFIDKNNLLPPTIIKMDIESSEYESLESSTDDFFSTVKLILLEYHDNVNGKIMPVIERFLNLGFRVCLKTGCNLKDLSGNLMLYK